MGSLPPREKSMSRRQAVGLGASGCAAVIPASRLGARDSPRRPSLRPRAKPPVPCLPHSPQFGCPRLGCRPGVHEKRENRPFGESRLCPLTLVGGLSKIRQPCTPSARSDTRPPPAFLILIGESSFWPANGREGRPKNAYFCPPTRVKSSSSLAFWRRGPKTLKFLHLRRAIAFAA